MILTAASLVLLLICPPEKGLSGFLSWGCVFLWASPVDPYSSPVQKDTPPGHLFTPRSSFYWDSSFFERFSEVTRAGMDQILLLFDLFMFPSL